METGDYEQAIEAFQRAIDIYPQYADAYNDLGDCLFRQGRTDDALDAFLKASKLAPGDEKILYNLAVTQYKKGQLLKARTTLEKILEINADNNRALKLSIIVNEEIGDLDKAINYALKLSSNLPGDAKAQYMLGALYLDKEDYQKAEPYLKKAVSLDATLIEARINLGILHIKQNRCQDAIEQLQAVLDMEKRSQVPIPARLHYRLQTNLGDAYQQCDDIPAACRAYKEALEYEQAEDELRLDLGSLYYQQKDMHSAERYLLEYLRIKPDDIEAKRLMGLISYKRGDFADATRYLRAVDEAGKLSLGELYLLAESCFKIDELNRALDALKRMIEGGVAGVREYQLMSKIYRYMGDNRSALRYLESALDLDPQNEDIKWQIEQLSPLVAAADTEGWPGYTPSEPKKPQPTSTIFVQKRAKPTIQPSAATAILISPTKLPSPEPTSRPLPTYTATTLPTSTIVIVRQPEINALIDIAQGYLKNGQRHLAAALIDEILSRDPYNEWAKERKMELEATKPALQQVDQSQGLPDGLIDRFRGIKLTTSDYALAGIIGFIAMIIIILAAVRIMKNRSKITRGQLKLVTLPNLLQILESKRATGIIYIKGDFGEGRLYLQEGRLLKTTLNKQSGKEVLFYMFTLHEGSFRFVPGEVKVKSEFDQSLKELIHEFKNPPVEQ